MALKAKQVFTATNENKVVAWDTTLTQLSVKLKAFDPEALSYHTLTRELKKGGEYRFKPKSGRTYTIQHLVR